LKLFELFGLIFVIIENSIYSCSAILTGELHCKHIETPE